MLTPAPASAFSPGQPAQSFCTGQDDRSIDRLYRAYFLRAPDAGGLAYWRGRMASGMSLNAISTYFASSPEFRARYGTLSDAGFVNLVYQNVMERPADSTGLAHWTGVLSRGFSRGFVMIGFSDSAEFKARTGLGPTVPSPNEPRAIPDVLPVQLPPGGTDDGSFRDHILWQVRRTYPLSANIDELFEHTARQIRCMGWTIVDQGSSAGSPAVGPSRWIEVRSPNNIMVEFVIRDFRQQTVNGVTHPSFRRAALSIQLR